MWSSPNVLMFQEKLSNLGMLGKGEIIMSIRNQ